MKDIKFVLEQPKEQPKETIPEQPLETEEDKLQRETNLLELGARNAKAILNKRQAIKQLEECQDCEALKVANQTLAESLSEKESTLTANALSLQELQAKVTEQADEVAKREKVVAKTELTQRKANTFLTNFAMAQKADNILRDLARVEKFVCQHQEHYALGDDKETSEVKAIKRIRALFEEGIE